MILEIFSIELWAREFGRQYLEMVDPDSNYNRIRRLIMPEKEPIICYHLNDAAFWLEAKGRERHADSTRWMWGHVVTNKFSRTDIKYARLTCPEGKRMNWITHATFTKLARHMKHEYIHLISGEQFEEDFMKRIPSLNNYQAQRLFKKLIQHNAFEDVGKGRGYYRDSEEEVIHVRLKHDC